MNTQSPTALLSSKNAEVDLLKSERTAPRLAESLKQLIYDGEFAPGDRLNEAALAQRMGTSRGPIREAMRLLAGWGLVTSIPNRGVFVRQFSMREMLEVYELRALLFGFAAEQAAERVTESDKRTLQNLLDQMNQASSDEDGTRYYELNLQFHLGILKLSGNQRARQAYDDYVKELHIFRRRYFNGPGNMRRSNEQHQQIFDAIAKGAGAEARAAAEQHVMAGHQRLLATMDTSLI